MARLPSVDAFATLFAGVLGTSSGTAYIESAAGVAAGGRTGLANLATAALLFASLLFYPLARLVGGAEVERGRVAQEFATLAERSDVTEELVRLEAHLVALRAALRASGPVGKRVEFLLQEVHRELNTTGSKAGDPAIVDLVLGAKGEVEKLREQVQNVE